ncbi:MAG: gamma-glutamyl-gamma-aminobutyrate hydrolase family protein [Candidatus Peribacteria bacterium]|nr:MAG: gamma-glutamyl-gamma-aminobutyrate hydrolase family protein [Candidatus Peribacteria bacterium]
MKKVLMSLHQDDNLPHQYGPALRAGYHAVYPFVAAGAMPIILPAGPLSQQQLREFVSIADIVVIHGGDDVNPKLYGEEIAYETVKTYQQRDELEIALVEEAMRQHKPVYGICR